MQTNLKYQNAYQSSEEGGRSEYVRNGFIPVGSNVDTSSNAARCNLTPTIRNHDMVVAPCSGEDRSQNGVNLSMP